EPIDRTIRGLWRSPGFGRFMGLRRNPVKADKPERLNRTRQDIAMSVTRLTLRQGRATIPAPGCAIDVTDGAKLYPFYGAISLQMKRFAVVLAIGLFAAVPASAQTFRPPDPGVRPWSTAQMNLGPVYFAPTFELSGVGEDKNVFNDETNPKSDLT